MQHLGDGIYCLEDFFLLHKKLKQQVVAECSVAEFTDYENNKIPVDTVNKSGYFLIKKESYLYDLILELNLSIESKIESFFNKKFISQWKNTENIGVISRYAIGGSLPDHADRVHLSGEYYSYSCVYYINENYKGGRLFFPEKNIGITPKENSIVFLPSHLIHRSEEITDGEKIVSATFFKEMNSAD